MGKIKYADRKIKPKVFTKMVDGKDIAWRDAFDKFGYGDGDGTIYTPEVAEFLESMGYYVEYDSWGMHNDVITTLVDPKGKVLIHGSEADGDKFTLGYDNPREYLPKALIAKLDEEFGVSPAW